MKPSVHPSMHLQISGVRAPLLILAANLLLLALFSDERHQPERVKAVATSLGAEPTFELKNRFCDGLQHLHSENPNLTRLHSALQGKSAGRAYAIELTSDFSDPLRPTVILAGSFARSLDIAQELLSGYGNNAEISQWMDSFRFLFLPSQEEVGASQSQLMQADTRWQHLADHTFPVVEFGKDNIDWRAKMRFLMAAGVRGLVRPSVQNAQITYTVTKLASGSTPLAVPEVGLHNKEGLFYQPLDPGRYKILFSVDGVLKHSEVVEVRDAMVDLGMIAL